MSLHYQVNSARINALERYDQALALQVVLRHLSSDYNVSALWIDTTGEFPADRMPSLIESCKGNVCNQYGVMKSVGCCSRHAQASSTALDRLQVALAFDVETAHEVLEMLRSTLSVSGVHLEWAY